ncbi:12397_t:CDS:10 [Acaulospora morrowiae]|uniref:12397_t:CDS:1 n=1 Tax=Acaulospora morrowiae TaxID=94023 RepID=A0A9N8YQX9_9GLOM|nr:12397_t:CDS:10 [Acaulospora morrowiae]
MFEESGFVTVTEPPQFVRCDKKPLGYKMTMSALLYAVLTDEDYENYYDYVTDHDNDKYTFLISLMVQIVAYKGFKLYSKKTTERVIYIIKNLIVDHPNIKNPLPALYDVVECILRQIRGGDTTEKNIWLIKEMHDLLSSETAWLYCNERLINITFYTFSSLARDHEKAGLDILRKQESIFCKRIFDEQYNTCFNIGRDLFRLLSELRNIPEFAYIFHGLDQNAEYCLNSRISSDLRARLIHYIENHTPTAYNRKFEVMFKEFFPVPNECRFLMADIFRWIIGAFRSNKPSINSMRCQLIKGLFLETANFGTSRSIVLDSMKMAMTLDLICFDRNGSSKVNENRSNLEPTFRLISELLNCNLPLVNEMIDYISSAIVNFAPGFEMEFRENLKAATLAMVRKNVISLEELNQMRGYAGETRAGRLMNDICIYVSNNQAGLLGTQIIPTQPNISMSFQQPQQQTNFSSRGPIFPSANPINHSDNIPFTQNSIITPPNPLTKSDNVQSYPMMVSQNISNQTTISRVSISNPATNQPAVQLPVPTFGQVQSSSSPHGIHQQTNISVSPKQQQPVAINVVHNSQQSSNVVVDSSVQHGFPQNARKPIASSSKPTVPNPRPNEVPATPLQEQRTPNSNSKALSGLSNLWLYVASLRSFDEAIKKNSFEEAIEFFGRILNTFMERANLENPNSPHLKDLPETIGKQICNSLDFNELHRCVRLDLGRLEISPSRVNLFNKLVDWVFEWQVKASDDESNKYKAFELLRLIANQADNPKEMHIKARTKLMVFDLKGAKLDKMGCADRNHENFLDHYMDYLSFEINKEKSTSDSDVDADMMERFMDDLECLKSNQSNLFLLITPLLLIKWPKYFVGNPKFIYLSINRINPMMVYIFETNIRQGVYKIIGDVDCVDDIIYHSLNWDSFDQLMLFHLLRAEIGGDKEKIEHFFCTSKFLPTLNPLENPEILTALMWILETIKPNSKILKSLFGLVANSATEDSKSENIKYIIAVFATFHKHFPAPLVTQLDSILKEILKHENSDDYITAVSNVMNELYKSANSDMVRGLLQLHHKVVEIGKMVDISIYNPESPIDASQKSEHMEIDEKDSNVRGPARAKRINDRKDRILRSQCKQPPTNPPQKDQQNVTSDEESEDEELPKISATKQRARNKIDSSSSEENSDSHTEQAGIKKNRQMRGITNVPSRQQSVPSNGEFHSEDGAANKNRNTRTRTTTLNRPTTPSQTNLGRRKNVNPANAKKRATRNLDEEES